MGSGWRESTEPSRLEGGGVAARVSRGAGVCTYLTVLYLMECL